MSIKVFRHSEEKHQKFEKYPEIISTDNRKLWKIRTSTVRKQNLPKKKRICGIHLIKRIFSFVETFENTFS